MLTRENYHQETDHVSHSAMEVFRRSRPLFHGRFVTGEIQPDPPTRAMEIGSVLHALVLEPETAGDVYAVWPGGDRRTKAGKAAWEDFQANSSGKIVLEPDELARVDGMAAAIRSNNVAAMLLESPGTVEEPITWVDEPTGVPCKARPDKLIESASVLVDLKTCADVSPDGFRRAVANFGYHRQAAWYTEAAYRVHGCCCQFLFVCVSKDQPHEVVVYELDSRAFDLGVKENLELIRELAGCRQAGDWSGRWAGEIQTVALPRWCYTATEEFSNA